MTKNLFFALLVNFYSMKKEEIYFHPKQRQQHRQRLERGREREREGEWDRQR